jgi:hypothetical protein
VVLWHGGALALSVGMYTWVSLLYPYHTPIIPLLHPYYTFIIPLLHPYYTLIIPSSHPYYMYIYSYIYVYIYLYLYNIGCRGWWRKLGPDDLTGWAAGVKSTRPRPMHLARGIIFICIHVCCIYVL